VYILFRTTVYIRYLKTLFIISLLEHCDWCIQNQRGIPATSPLTTHLLAGLLMEPTSHTIVIVYLLDLVLLTSWTHMR